MLSTFYVLSQISRSLVDNSIQYSALCTGAAG